MTSKLYPYTFTDSGITITIRKISPNTLMEFQRWFERNHIEPTAPVNKVTYPDGQVVDEENLSHPDYKKALQDYRVLYQRRMQELFVRRGVVIELNEAQLKEVNDLKAEWQAQYNEEIGGSDKEIYIEHICISTPEEMKELIEVISRRTLPTEAAVSEATARF